MRTRKSKRVIAIAVAAVLVCGAAVAQAATSGGPTGLLFTQNADGSAAAKLSRATVPSSVTVLLASGSSQDITKVDFYLDDPAGLRAPAKTLTSAPFAVLLSSLSTAAITPGDHSVLAVLVSSSGANHDLFARFKVGDTPSVPTTSAPTTVMPPMTDMPTTVPQSTPTTAAPGATTADVTIEGFAFAPASLTVAVGTTVTWTNLDNVTHTVTSGAGRVADGLFDGAVDSGQTFSFTFTTPGTFEYFCKPHSNMVATVIVQ